MAEEEKVGAGCRTGKQEPHTMMLDKNTDQPLQKIPLVLLSVNTLFFPLVLHQSCRRVENHC